MEGAIWRLTLYGWLGPWERDAEEYAYPERIHGQVGTTPVTLLDTVPGGWSTSGDDPPYESSLAANTVLAGAFADHDSRFKSAAVRLLHLNEWADRRPWKFGSGDTDGLQHSVAFSDPGPLRARLPEATAVLERGWGRRGGFLSSVTMESDEWVHFDFDKPADLETIEHEYVRPLRSLIELAAAARSATLVLNVVPVDAYEFTSSATVLSAVSRDIGEPKHSSQMVLRLQDIDFEALLSAWWQLHSEVAVVCDLLAALKGRGYVGSQFLTAASAIEAYHRHRHGKAKSSMQHKQRVRRIVESAPIEDRDWLKAKLAFSHQPEFAERIDEVIERAGPLFAKSVGDLEKWRTWVKNARNSVAHRDPSMMDVDRDWRITIRVTPTIEWLMTLVLLRDLGIDDEVIEAGVRRERSLDAVREHLRLVKPEWFD